MTGGYVAAGSALRNTGAGRIALTGIPDGSTVVKAYLVWDVIDTTSQGVGGTGIFNGRILFGIPQSSGASPCWGSGSNFSYAADVTDLVDPAGNGTYALSGFASGTTSGEDPWANPPVSPLAEGASLFVAYSNPQSTPTTVALYTGATMTAGSTLSQTLSGFTASAKPKVTTTFIVADGQNAPDGPSTFNGVSLDNSSFSGADPLLTGGSYSRGNLWDTKTFDVSAQVAPGDTTAVATISGTSDCLVWVGQALSVGAARPEMTALTYVAMGDSFSSGESIPPYIFGSTIENLDSAKDGCHRSGSAYPELLAGAFSPGSSGEGASTDLQFIACSGATTAQMLGNTRDGKGSHGESAQSQQLGEISSQLPKGRPDLVTFTVAGDDIGFASVIKRCISDYTGWSFWSGSTNQDCANDHYFVDATANTINGIEPTLQTAYTKLTSSLTSDTSVMIADYPQIFPGEPESQNCVQLNQVLSGQDQNLFRGWTDTMDNEISQATAADGLNFVEVRPTFAGHAICESGGAWLNAVTNINGWKNPSGSFHPTWQGQQGYADAFESFISSQVANGVKLTPAGLPMNPGTGGGSSTYASLRPAVSAASSSTPVKRSTTDTLRMGPLSVTTAFSDSGTCPNVYQPGQTINVSGSGFKAGSTATVTVLPRTKLATVMSVRADASGAIDVTFRLPMNLSEARVVSGQVPLGYIEASAPGATSTTQTDNLLFNVAPHGDACGGVDTMPFTGFESPVTNLPAVNAVHPGQTVPVKFTIANIPGTIDEVIAPGYPISSPVSCASFTSLTHGTPTLATANPKGLGASDHYNYTWATDPGWSGCREIDVRLADGSDHQAVFDFGK